MVSVPDLHVCVCVYRPVRLAEIDFSFSLSEAGQAKGRARGRSDQHLGRPS